MANGISSGIAPVAPTFTPKPTTPVFPGYGQMPELGSNWRIKFADADGLPLNMVSFEVIDFGAIAYKEIFQNVKTILATPLYSAALERLMGIDESIVDLPLGRAAEAVVAILDALYFWEARVEVMNISFAADALNAHLICNLQLAIRNVIYGSDTPYDRNNVFGTPLQVPQGLPPSAPPPAPAPPSAGAGVPVPGPAGQRGSLWFTGTGAPPATGPMVPVAAASQGAQGPQGPRGFIWLQGQGAPDAVPQGVTPQAFDMYLNVSNGDVYQFNGTTWAQGGEVKSEPETKE